MACQDHGIYMPVFSVFTHLLLNGGECFLCTHPKQNINLFFTSSYSLPQFKYIYIHFMNVNTEVLPGR